MTFAELVRRYQAFDPATGEFTAVRSQKDYAALLGVDSTLLNKAYAGRALWSVTLLRALVRAFPAAEADALAAMRGVESPDAVPA